MLSSPWRPQGISKPRLWPVAPRVLSGARTPQGAPRSPRRLGGLGSHIGSGPRRVGDAAEAQMVEKNDPLPSVLGQPAGCGSPHPLLPTPAATSAPPGGRAVERRPRRRPSSPRSWRRAESACSCEPRRRRFAGRGGGVGGGGNGFQWGSRPRAPAAAGNAALAAPQGVAVGHGPGTRRVARRRRQGGQRRAAPLPSPESEKVQVDYFAGIFRPRSPI